MTVCSSGSLLLCGVSSQLAGNCTSVTPPHSATTHAVIWLGRQAPTWGMSPGRWLSYLIEIWNMRRLEVAEHTRPSLCLFIAIHVIFHRMWQGICYACIILELSTTLDSNFKHMFYRGFNSWKIYNGDCRLYCLNFLISNSQQSRLVFCLGPTVLQVCRLTWHAVATSHDCDACLPHPSHQIRPTRERQT